MNPWDEKAADVAELVALEASEWSPAVATRFGCFMSGARWQREALLADDVIERAARAFYEAGNDVRHESHLLSWDRLVEASPAVANGYRDHMRAALEAALGIEGEES